MSTPNKKSPMTGAIYGAEGLWHLGNWIVPTRATRGHYIRHYARKAASNLPREAKGAGPTTKRKPRKQCAVTDYGSD